MKIIFSFILLLIGSLIQAQQAVLPAAGHVSTASGSVTYSVGHMVYVPVKCSVVTTFTSGSWSNGAPNANKKAIIASDFNTLTETASLEACELIINADVTLTITAGYYLKSVGDITVNGNLVVNHEGSVVQVNDDAVVTKNGTITVKKTTPFLKARDLMLVGSPMTAETRFGVHANSFRVYNHLTPNFVPNTAVASFETLQLLENFADDNGDNWTFHETTLTPGVGYGAKMQPDNSTSGSYNLDYTLGTLNNGVINFNVLFNTDQNSSPNMLSNPYASAIDADVFLAENSMIDALYFWEHLTAASPSYPGYYSTNYDMGDISIYNGTGGLKASNDLGTATTPNGFISSGQGFAVKATAAGTAVFNNSMRVTGNNNTYNRNASAFDRIWLQVKNTDFNLNGELLIGFNENASDNYDAKYDAKRLATSVSIYSELPSGLQLGIQGRSAFTEEQEVQLGFSTTIDAENHYIISISNIERALMTDDVPVILRDNVLQTETNLLEQNYSFTSTFGEQKNRFTLLFRESNNTEEQTEGTMTDELVVYPNPTNDVINLSLNISDLKSVEIFDLRGRRVLQQSFDATSKSAQLNLSSLKTAMYLMNVHTTNGIFTEKIIKN